MEIITRNIDNRQSCEANARRKARKSEGTIEDRVRHEAEGRSIARRQVDVMSGLTKSSGPSRGDYRLCRQADKVLKEYRNHKDPRARAEIQKHYEQCQKEYRIDMGGRG